MTSKGGRGPDGTADVGKAGTGGGAQPADTGGATGLALAAFAGAFFAGAFFAARFCTTFFAAFFGAVFFFAAFLGAAFFLAAFLGAALAEAFLTGFFLVGMGLSLGVKVHFSEHSNIARQAHAAMGVFTVFYPYGKIEP